MTVVLLHGFASSFTTAGDRPLGWTSWPTSAARSPEIDLPGHGSSPHLLDPRAYDDVEAQLFRALPPETPVPAVGFSAGADLGTAPGHRPSRPLRPDRPARPERPRLRAGRARARSSAHSRATKSPRTYRPACSTGLAPRPATIRSHCPPSSVGAGARFAQRTSPAVTCPVLVVLRRSRHGGTSRPTGGRTTVGDVGDAAGGRPLRHAVGFRCDRRHHEVLGAGVRRPRHAAR